MKLSRFAFELPEELIAQYPLKYRDDSKLMVADRKTEKITHHKFRDILNFFDKGDALVLNNTKVGRNFLKGNKIRTRADVDVLLLRELNRERHLWDSIINPARKIRVGNRLYFGEYAFIAEVVDNTTSRGRTIRFDFDGSSEDLRILINRIGSPPLPVGINRVSEKIDFERYQTIFAKYEGSVVPPVAGFHFTNLILKTLELKEILLPEITLHASYSNLSTLEGEDLAKYKISSDPYIIKKQDADIINKVKKNRKKVCAVDVSTLQCIESAISSIGGVRTVEDGWTSKFIYPPYNLKVADCLLTNFYLPKSLPYINSAGFGGFNFIANKVYPEAIKNGYRFFVYGDALLIT